jgi:DNA polymerase (family 10)
VTNLEIARALYDLADAIELVGDADAQFRVRALRSGAKRIEAMNESVAERSRAGTLKGLPGIGAGITRRIEELVATGRIADLDELRKMARPGLLEIARVEGIGPKTAQLLYTELGIESLDALEAACRAQALRALPRMGARKEEQILAAISRARADTGRWRIHRAEREATPLVERVRALPGVERAAVAGSLRRLRDTIGDVDLLVAASGEVDPIMAAIAALPGVAVVLARGPTKLSLKTGAGLQVDVRVVKPESWGAALAYFTGSKDHNVRIRALGVKRGLLINEYGVFEGRGDGARLGGAEEQEIFAAVGLPWIPPELREDKGEIEAGLAGALPRLVEIGDLRGDCHMHTTETDGRNSLEEMVQAALELGRSYIAITDHSANLKMVRGLDPDRLREQGRQIDALNEKLAGRLRVLRGIEADILPDGSVDLGPEVLGSLDWVIGSVHGQFNLPREEQTRRIVTAIESGDIDVLGHPTGRLLETRAPYDVDLDAVVDAAARTGVALECNAYPDRLDLDDRGCRMARERGAFIIIDTDSHATSHLQGIGGGVRQARRGGLEPRHVLNTRDVDGLLDHKRSRKGRASRGL